MGDPTWTGFSKVGMSYRTETTAPMEVSLTESAPDADAEPGGLTAALGVESQRPQSRSTRPPNRRRPDPERYTLDLR